MSNMWHSELGRLRAIEPDDLPVFRREGVANADDSQLYDDRRYPPLTVAAHGARMSRAPSDNSDDLTIESESESESVDGDELVGSLSANHCDRRTGTFEVGFGIFTAHRRRGYVSEGIKILMRYYFEEQRYQKVNAFSEPSLAAHRHPRFVEEGRRRRVGFSGGEHFDDVLFGMTVEEFHDHFGGPQRPSAT